MSYLIDTNIISEIRKGARCDEAVAAWYASIPEDGLFLSVFILGEIRKGVERVRPRDPAKADALDRWVEAVEAAFGDRVLPVGTVVAREWGRMSAIRPISVINGLLAATAKVHGLTLVTRNESDVAGLGAAILNPFR